MLRQSILTLQRHLKVYTHLQYCHRESYQQMPDHVFLSEGKVNRRGISTLDCVHVFPLVVANDDSKRPPLSRQWARKVDHVPTDDGATQRKTQLDEFLSDCCVGLV